MNLFVRVLGFESKSKSPSIPLLQRGMPRSGTPPLSLADLNPPFEKGGQGGFAFRSNGKES